MDVRYEMLNVTDVLVQFVAQEYRSNRTLCVPVEGMVEECTLGANSLNPKSTPTRTKY